MIFHHVIESIVTFFSKWNGAYRQQWSNLSTVSFFFSFFFSSPSKITIWLSLLLISQFQSLFVWFLIFVHGSSIEVLFVFNFIIQSHFNIYYFFLIWSLFFWFLVFFPCAFCKILLVFNFILQSKLMVLCFLICSLFFLFLIYFLGPFVKVIILFNVTL